MSDQLQELFIAYTGGYSDRRAVGVFSTREAAKAASDDCDFNVERWFLDNDPSKAEGLKVYHIIMDRNGNSLEAKEIDFSGREEDPELIPNEPWRKEYRGCCSFEIVARSLEHALKSANEKRTRMIAEGEWK